MWKASHNLPEPAWTGWNDDQPRQSIVEPSPREIPEHDESSLPGAIVAISIAQTIVLLLITFNSIHYWIKGSGAAQRKEKTTLPDDPVTITFVRTNAGSTFRYW